jgi:hypothetical protein
MSTPSDFSTERVAILSDDSVQMQQTVETSYRALSGLAVTSLILGCVSALTFLDWSLAIVPIVGIAVGWIALRRIRRNPQESMGEPWALAGVALCAVFWVVGYGWLAYGYFHQVPEGYELISYKSLQPDPNRPDQRVSEEAEMLDKRKVFIWGWMYPGRQRTGIKEFLLVDDPGTCNFCAPQPRPSQLIRIKLINNLKAEYTTHQIGVGGELTVYRDPADESSGGLLYQIEADCLR